MSLTNNEIVYLRSKLFIIFITNLQKYSFISRRLSFSDSNSRHILAPSTYSSIVGCNEHVSLSRTNELKNKTIKYYSIFTQQQ